MSGWRRLAAAAAVLLAVAACRSGGAKEDPMLAMSAEEALIQGKQLMEEEKYRRAQDFLTHAFEVAPNSASGREGLLLAADALYLNGGQSNFIKAEAKYNDFLNRFPTSDRAPYVQFQMANCLVRRMRKPDRDQSVSRQALGAYREVVQLYPDSEYATEAREQIGLVRENLAEHEFVVGRFNYRFRLYDAAAARFETVLAEYADTRAMEASLYYLGLTQIKLLKPDEARQAFDRLRGDYPQSPYLEKIPSQQLDRLADEQPEKEVA